MNQVGSCSVEVKTVPVKPSLLNILFNVVAVVLVASILLAPFLPYLVHFSMWVLS